MKFALEAGPDTMNLAVELGISGVPVNGAAVAADTEAALDPLRERGLKPCQISAFGYNPLQDDATRAEPEALVARLLELAPTIDGNPCVVIPGGNYNADAFGQTDPRNFGPEALRSLAERLGPLLDLAEKHGARLSIEPYLKGAMDSPERCRELAAVLNNPPALRFNLDPSSLYDFRDFVDPAPMVERVCSILGPVAGVIHVKEVGLDKGFHLHAGLVPLGKGSTDWAAYLRQAGECVSSDTWVLLEHCLSAEEARSSVACLRKAAAEAGVTLE